MRIRHISGALYGSRLVEQPHVRPEAEALVRFVEPVKVLLEIGFDHGFRLFDMAQRNPDWRFVGLEVRLKRVREFQQRVSDAGLDNVFAWRMDARTVFGCVLPTASLDCVHIMYPTPWWDPKKRQKRLLISAEFLVAVRDTLRIGGLIRIETDVSDYARIIEAEMRDVAGLAMLDESVTRLHEPACGVVSRRQRKTARENLPIYRFLLQRQHVSETFTDET